MEKVKKRVNFGEFMKNSVFIHGGLGNPVPLAMAKYFFF